MPGALQDSKSESIVTNIKAKSRKMENLKSRITVKDGISVVPTMAHVLQAGESRSEDVCIEEDVQFADMFLKDEVLDGLLATGFKKPSPVQLQAIPPGRCGLDLIVQAKSGTGKTCVFTVLALEMIAASATTTQVIVLAPTREIAVQISSVMISIGRKIEGLQIETFIGGTAVTQPKVCHIAVGTPGRLHHMLTDGKLSARHVRLLVLDEADQLLESFMNDVQQIVAAMPHNKQVICTSATYTPSLQELAKTIMRAPTHVTLGSKQLLAVTQYVHKLPYSSQSPNHNFRAKLLHLKGLLGSVMFNQCLVFANTVMRAESVYDSLRSEGWPVSLLSGKQTQDKRLESLNQLVTHQCRVLVATDLAARGLDSPHVSLVVSMEPPVHPHTYMHRVGRAGRFGSEGRSVLLVSEGDDWLHARAMATVMDLRLLVLPEPSLEGVDKVEHETLPHLTEEQLLQWRSSTTHKLTDNAGSAAAARSSKRYSHNEASDVWTIKKAEHVEEKTQPIEEEIIPKSSIINSDKEQVDDEKNPQKADLNVDATAGKTINLSHNGNIPVSDGETLLNVDLNMKDKHVGESLKVHKIKDKDAQVTKLEFDIVHENNGLQKSFVKKGEREMPPNKQPLKQLLKNTEVNGAISNSSDQFNKSHEVRVIAIHTPTCEDQIGPESSTVDQEKMENTLQTSYNIVNKNDNHADENVISSSNARGSKKTAHRSGVNANLSTNSKLSILEQNQMMTPEKIKTSQALLKSSVPSYCTIRASTLEIASAMTELDAQPEDPAKFPGNVGNLQKTTNSPEEFLLLKDCLSYEKTMRSSEHAVIDNVWKDARLNLQPALFQSVLKSSDYKGKLNQLLRERSEATTAEYMTGKQEPEQQVRVDEERDGKHVQLRAADCVAPSAADINVDVSTAYGVTGASSSASSNLVADEDAATIAQSVAGDSVTTFTATSITTAAAIDSTTTSTGPACAVALDDFTYHIEAMKEGCRQKNKKSKCKNKALAKETAATEEENNHGYYGGHKYLDDFSNCHGKGNERSGSNRNEWEGYAEYVEEALYDEYGDTLPLSSKQKPLKAAKDSNKKTERKTKGRGDKQVHKSSIDYNNPSNSSATRINSGETSQRKSRVKNSNGKCDSKRAGHRSMCDVPGCTLPAAASDSDQNYGNEQDSNDEYDPNDNERSYYRGNENRHDYNYHYGDQGMQRENVGSWYTSGDATPRRSNNGHCHGCNCHLYDTEHGMISSSSYQRYMHLDHYLRAMGRTSARLSQQYQWLMDQHR